MSTNKDIVHYDEYDSNFINKLLGEMKCKFNKLDELSTKSKDKSKNVRPAIEEGKTKEEAMEIEDILGSNEPDVESPSKTSKKTSPNRRSYRQRNSSLDEKVDIEENLKRSSRRRNKRSVLQNAIDRKEKSYNESCRPQRLSRQLRPTKKVLENIAQAKEVKKLKSKNTDKPYNSENQSSIDGDSKKSKTASARSHKNQKRLKASDSEKSHSEVSSEGESEVEVVKSIRKSPRSSSQNLNSPKHQLAIEAENGSPITQENPVLAAQLCLCSETTNFYQANINSDITHCSAIDNIDERLIGCNRQIKIKDFPLLRPSRRIPYMGLCELHRNRLKQHNCCPTCGIFCTQGKFSECEAKHQYHQKCRLSVGNTECCPHCGLTTPSRDILLKFKCSNAPVFLPVQKSERFSQHAKMTFSKTCGQIRSSTPLLIPLDSFQNLDNALTNGSDMIFDENDILDAIREEDFEKLTSIIASNSIDLQFKLEDFNEGNLLHYASHKGLLRICHILISMGSEINEIDKEQNTPLMLAIIAHKMDVVQYLVHAGSNIAVKGTDGMTALHVSAKCGNLDACRILLEASSSFKDFINCRDDGGWTPLVWGCENGFAEIVEFLLSKGADPKLRDVEHNEALHWASFSGCSHIVELLINRGADVNTVNAHGESPLHIAAREDRYNCVIVLLARRANVYLVNKNNETPLNCVPEDGMCYNPIALNMRLQSLVDSENKPYKTVLSEDISKGRELNPVQCVNNLDEDLEPKGYTYVTKCFISSEGVCIDTTPKSVKNCNCQERCFGENCLCGHLSVKCWYDEERKLSADFNFLDTPIIFECSDTCTCNAITCRNRVVQRGTQQRFQVYKTERKGWSVRTLKFIPKGCFVSEYVGEILTDADADQRDDDSFLFDLGNEDVERFCVDAHYYGNVTRFINHSCDPNLHPIKVFTDHQDLRFPKIALFALKDIANGEELSFDYGGKFWLAKYKTFSCHCGSNECRYSKETIGQSLAYTECIDEDSLSS